MAALRMTGIVAPQRRQSGQGALVFLGAVAAYPYLLLSADFVDVRIGSTNLQVLGITLVLVACAIARRQWVAEALGWQVLMALGLGLVFVAFKVLTGQLHPGGLPVVRLLFMLPLVWALYTVYATDEATRNAVTKIIVWNCVFIALFGVVHFFFFPSAVLSSTASESYRAGAASISLIPGHSQESAFFGNPSAYGAILLAGLFAIYLARWRTWPYLCAFLLIALASYLSVSRAAWAFTTLLLVPYLGRAISWKRPTRALPALLVIFVGLYVMGRVPFFGLAIESAVGRLRLLSGSLSLVGRVLLAGRAQRYAVGLHLLFQDLPHFFVGTADTEPWVVRGYVFSDNSFIILALDFGVPLAVLWMLTVLPRTIPLRFRVGLGEALLVLFLYVMLFTTPSVAWDIWLLYGVAPLAIRSHTRWGPQIAFGTPHRQAPGPAPAL